MNEECFDGQHDHRNRDRPDEGVTPCDAMQGGQPPERTRALFGRVQRMAKIGVWTLNIQDGRLEWSEELYRIFEIDPFRFEPTYEFLIRSVHPDDRDAVNSAHLTSLENRSPCAIEHRLLMPDGRIKHVREECETCFDENNEPVASYGTVQDITLLKTLEAEKETHRQMLLHQSKLAHMGEMIDTITHQWKQPLHQINAILPVLEMRYKAHSFTPEELASQLDEIEMLTMHMSQTVESFRHFIHPRQTETEFNVNDAVHDTLALLKSELDRLGVVYEFIAEKPYTCAGNKEEFMQALLTILGNALECFRHRAVAAPALRIEAAHSRMDMTISISDNAGGIPGHFINKVFDLYFTTKIDGHGTGLGLYVAKMLIEKSMKGTITAENGREGAIFTIFLPHEAPKK